MEPTALKNPENVQFKPLDEKQKKETIKKISKTLSIKPHASINANKFLLTSFLSILLVFAIGILGMLLTGQTVPTTYSTQQTTTTPSTKIKKCPDAWYENRMPGSDNKTEEYLVFEGERKEIAHYDLEWIQQNCEVNKSEAVY